MEETTLLSIYLLSAKPQGVFIGTREKEARVCGHGRARMAAETQLWPCFRDHSTAVRAATCRALSCRPLLAACPDFGF